LQAEGMPAARAVALGVHLRNDLAERDERPVVDAERTLQAQQQLGATGGATDDPEALREVAAAQRVLLPVLHARDGGWQLVATLDGAGGGDTTLAGPVEPDPRRALGAWRRAPDVVAALGPASGPASLGMPGAEAALDALGAGMAARHTGDLQGALRHYQAATAAEPGYADAWLGLAETALAIGEQELAYEALQRGADALPAGAPDALRRRLAAELALMEGDPVAAVATWRARAEVVPDDTFAALQLARAQGAGGDFAAAVAGLEALSRRDPNDPRAWYELGKFSILSGDARRAVDEHLVRALVLFKRGGNRFGEAETLNALGIGYGRLGQTADAAQQYRAAATLRAAIGNRRGVATSLRNLANIESMTGELEAAAGHLDEARALYAALGDRDGLAAIDNELGLL